MATRFDRTSSSGGGQRTSIALIDTFVLFFHESLSSINRRLNFLSQCHLKSFFSDFRWKPRKAFVWRPSMFIRLTLHRRTPTTVDNWLNSFGLSISIFSRRTRSPIIQVGRSSAIFSPFLIVSSESLEIIFSAMESLLDTRSKLL